MTKSIVWVSAIRGIFFFSFLIFFVEPSSSVLVVPNVILTWDPSPDTNVVGYYLSSGTESGNYTNRVVLGNLASTAVFGLSKGTTYYFAVTACNADGLESDPSNEISFDVPGILRVAQNPAANGSVRVEFPVQTGRTYILQASYDLVSWLNIWETVGTTYGWIGWDDPDAEGSAQRFYRLKLL